jgi:hypothetical protein
VSQLTTATTCYTGARHVVGSSTQLATENHICHLNIVDTTATAAESNSDSNSNSNSTKSRVTVDMISESVPRDNTSVICIGYDCLVHSTTKEEWTCLALVDLAVLVLDGTTPLPEEPVLASYQATTTTSTGNNDDVSVISTSAQTMDSKSRAAQTHTSASTNTNTNTNTPINSEIQLSSDTTGNSLQVHGTAPTHPHDYSSEPTAPTMSTTSGTGNGTGTGSGSGTGTQMTTPPLPPKARLLLQTPQAEYVAFLTFRPLSPRVAKFGKYLGIWVASADDALLRFYTTVSSTSNNDNNNDNNTTTEKQESRLLQPLPLISGDAFQFLTSCMALDFMSLPQTTNQQKQTHALAVACQDGTIRILSWQDDDLSHISTTEVIVDGPIVSVQLSLFDGRLQLTAGSLCGHACRLLLVKDTTTTTTTTTGNNNNWQGPIAVGPGFWTIGNAEDSVLCVHAFDDKYIAVGTHAGKCHLFQLAGETYLQLWECTLPYSIHGICHMMDDDDHHDDDKDVSPTSIRLVVTTRRSIHVLDIVKLTSSYVAEKAKTKLHVLRQRLEEKEREAAETKRRLQEQEAAAAAVVAEQKALEEAMLLQRQAKEKAAAEAAAAAEAKRRLKAEEEEAAAAAAEQKVLEEAMLLERQEKERKAAEAAAAADAKRRLEEEEAVSAAAEQKALEEAIQFKRQEQGKKAAAAAEAKRHQKEDAEAVYNFFSLNERVRKKIYPRGALDKGVAVATEAKAVEEATLLERQEKEKEAAAAAKVKKQEETTHKSTTTDETGKEENVDTKRDEDDTKEVEIAVTEPNQEMEKTQETQPPTHDETAEESNDAKEVKGAATEPNQDIVETQETEPPTNEKSVEESNDTKEVGIVANEPNQDITETQETEPPTNEKSVEENNDTKEVELAATEPNKPHMEETKETEPPTNEKSVEESNVDLSTPSLPYSSSLARMSWSSSSSSSEEEEEEEEVVDIQSVEDLQQVLRDIPEGETVPIDGRELLSQGSEDRKPPSQSPPPMATELSSSGDKDDPSPAIEEQKVLGTVTNPDESVVAEEDLKPSSSPLSMELSSSEDKDTQSFEEQQKETDEQGTSDASDAQEDDGPFDTNETESDLATFIENDPQLVEKESTASSQEPLSTTGSREVTKEKESPFAAEETKPPSAEIAIKKDIEEAEKALSIEK